MGSEMCIRDSVKTISTAHTLKQQAITNDFVDSGASVGPIERIKDRFKVWESSGVTGLTISGNSEAIKTMAEVARLNFEAQPKV